MSVLQLVKSRVGNDRYAERGMNTFNEPPKTKNIQTTKIVYNVRNHIMTETKFHEVGSVMNDEDD